MKILLVAILATLMLCEPARAIPGDPLDVQVRIGRLYTSHVINADGTAAESVEWSKTVLKDTALEGAKQASIGYSTSAQKAEVIAAYTLKADGRRIEVRKDNYQVEVNSGRDKGSPAYSDWTTLSIIFPDVAVGDSVVFSYRITQTEPMFPKHYSTSHVFSDRVAYDDVRVRFDYPKSLWAQYRQHGMKEVENAVTGERHIVEWRHANPKPVESARRDYSVFDPDQAIGYAFSTFKTYAEIAAAYGERAARKAEVTDRIKQLAGDIVKGKTDPREQARALYEWVATNITYAGNCIGIGAVVPRDLPFVLDNKMGDCKDHATLLQALLAARGIKSTQALVNAGSMYRLPRIPVVASVNHVINYLPAFDLYIDSTSDSTPFGMLPFSDQDKPVLLVDGFREGAKTPVPPVGSNSQHARSTLRIAADGSVSGEVEVSQNGRGAVSTRASARQMSKDAEKDLVKNLLRGQGMIGSGKFEKDDPTGLLDSYHYKMSLNAEKFLKLPGTGAFFIHPPLGIFRSIGDIVETPTEPEKEVDIVCSGITASEEYVIQLPDSVKVLSVPDDMKIAGELLSYSATYKLDGNRLTVERKVEDRIKGNICSPRMIAEYKKTGDKVIDNLKEQVLYKSRP